AVPAALDLTNGICRLTGSPAPSRNRGSAGLEPRRRMTLYDGENRLAPGWVGQHVGNRKSYVDAHCPGRGGRRHAWAPRPVGARGVRRPRLLACRRLAVLIDRVSDLLG